MPCHHIAANLVMCERKVKNWYEKTMSWTRRMKEHITVLKERMLHAKVSALYSWHGIRAEHFEARELLFESD